MSDYDDYEDDDNSQDAGNAVKQLRNANKAKDKQIKELLEKVSLLQSGVRDRSVKDTIKAKGLPEKVASLIPESLTPSEEVEAWVNDYADVFGVTTPQDSPPADAGKEANPQFDALQRIANTQAGGQPFSGDEAQMLALIKSATDPEALNQLLFGSQSGPPVI